jgi:hypothetical protein
VPTASKGVVFRKSVQAHESGGGTLECVSVMQPAVGDGVTSISEPVTREPWRAMRRDYSRDATMLEVGVAHNCKSILQQVWQRSCNIIEQETVTDAQQRGVETRRPQVFIALESEDHSKLSIL